MEITKEVLQTRVAGMNEQMEFLSGEAMRIQGAIHQVRGGLNLCQDLMKYLEAPEPEEPPESEPAAQFEGANVEGLAEGRVCGNENEESIPPAAETEETTVPTG